MTRWQRRFAILVALEWCFAGAVMARYAGQARIPAVKLDHVDMEVAQAIAWHQRWIDLSRGENWLAMAKLYLAYGCLPEAEICCRQATELAPESKDAFYLRAVVLDRLGRLDDAEKQLAKAIDLGAGESAAWVRLGRIKLRQEAPSEAEQAFRTALKMDPDAIVAAIGLGRILLRTGRPEAVADVLSPFREKRPREHAPCQLLALAEAALGHSQAAERYLLEAEWRPDVSRFADPQADVNGWAAQFGALRFATESHTASAAGEAEAAATLMHHALSLGWDDHLANQAAAAYLEAKQPQEALDLVRRTIQVAGKSEYTLWLEGDAYALLDRIGPAQDAWLESVKLLGNEGAHRRLARYYERQNSEAAQRHLALALYFGGLNALQAGDPEKTEQMLEASLDFKPDQSMAWYFLGETKRYQGDAEAARQAYRRCLELQPEHGRAQESLSALDSADETGDHADAGET
ncbi:MAG TPA: tetratricopeptide repeat protein [Pirellulales bacterium]|nr:tetratricopeptide repeat protein [Pirellulales bacterium]